MDLCLKPCHKSVGLNDLRNEKKNLLQRYAQNFFVNFLNQPSMDNLQISSYIQID